MHYCIVSATHSSYKTQYTVLNLAVALFRSKAREQGNRIEQEALATVTGKTQLSKASEVKQAREATPPAVRLLQHSIVVVVCTVEQSGGQIAARNWPAENQQLPSRKARISCCQGSGGEATPATPLPPFLTSNKRRALAGCISNTVSALWFRILVSSCSSSSSPYQFSISILSYYSIYLH